MRIIAGKCRGRRLATAKGQNTRPTGDRVKEAIFSTLGQRLPQARVLDVFAGSGALGLEALSRGAAGAVFLEKDALARQVINKNIQTLALPGAKLYAGAAEQLLPQLKSRGTIDCFELIFLDPPYNRGLLNPMIALIRQLALLTAEGIAVVETTAKNSELELDCHWRILQRRVYGDTEIYYCGWRRAENKEDDYGRQ